MKMRKINNSHCWWSSSSRERWIDREWGSVWREASDGWFGKGETHPPSLLYHVSNSRLLAKRDGQIALHGYSLHLHKERVSEHAHEDIRHRSERVEERGDDEELQKHIRPMQPKNGRRWRARVVREHTVENSEMANRPNKRCWRKKERKNRFSQTVESTHGAEAWWGRKGTTIGWFLLLHLVCLSSIERILSRRANRRRNRRLNRLTFVVYVRHAELMRIFWSHSFLFIFVHVLSRFSMHYYRSTDSYFNIASQKSKVSLINKRNWNHDDRECRLCI